MLAVYAAAAAAAAIPTTEIAPGVEMPLVNLGTCCGSDTQVGLQPWLDAGGRGVDTSDDTHDPSYDEHDIGKILRKAGNPPRSEVFITTKIAGGLDPDRSCAEGSAGAALGLDLVKSNLKILNSGCDGGCGIDYVDLVLIHRPCPTDAQTQGIWQGLEQAVAQNLTRAIGLSNFNITSIKALLTTAKVKPAVHQAQVWGSATTPKAENDETIAFCQKEGITYESFFALRYCNKTSPVMTNIASKYHKTPSQVCLRYVLDRGVVLAVGTGNDPSTVQQYTQEDLDIFDFKLTADEVDAIGKM